MTVNIAYADSSDGHLLCQSADYNTARNGAGTMTVDTGSSGVAWGQAITAGATYWHYQAFESFTFTVPATESVVSASIRVRSTGAFNTGISRYLTWQEYDWGTSLTAEDWRTSSWWATVPLLANAANAQGAPSGQYFEAGGDTLVGRVQAGTSPLRVVGRSDRQAIGVVPTIQEDAAYTSANNSGTTSDPALVWTTVPKSAHEHVAGGQVRLSTGAWVYLLSNGASTPQVTLRYRTSGGTTSDIATLPIGSSSTDFATPGGLQSLALVRDAWDNLYVIGAQGSNTGAVAVMAWVKGSGATWSSRSMVAAPLPQYIDAGINNIAAGWHNTGNWGTIMAVCARGVGRWNLNPTHDVTYALIDPQRVTCDLGSLIKSSGSAQGLLVPSTTAPGLFTAPTNPTGTGLDVQVPPSAGTRGYVYCWNANTPLGANGGHASARYVLNDNGSGINRASLYIPTPSWGVKDAAGKARVLALSDSMFATVTVDSDPGYGPTFRVIQHVGDASTYSPLGNVTLDGRGPASLPSAATLATTAAWDAVYDNVDNRIWFYYIDKDNARRLCRTSIDLNTYLPAADEVEVTATLGAGAGAVCRSVRVERGSRAGDAYVLVTAATTLSGAHTSDFYVDAMNRAPTAPILTPKANFDADQAATFTWSFNDPVASDTQSAYELDMTDGENVYNTGKVTSAVSSATLPGGTLTNGKSYLWHVRCYDQGDLESPWSADGAFDTVNGATVTITDPASDGGTIDYASYMVGWSVEGATQDSYRVRVVDTGTSVALVDTGWVTSTETTHEITGLLSDVTYRIEVTVRESGVASNTATRTLLPTYGHPEVPTLTVTTGTDRLIVTVTNPTPTGDTPEAHHNEVFRRVEETDAWESLGQAQINGLFDDYTAASGVEYTYMVRAMAGMDTSSPYTDSATTDTGTLALLGVWIHDPIDPAGTIRNYPYGKDCRSDTSQIEQQGQHYAGRSYPVYDYGDAQDDAWSLRIDVPTGVTWRSDLAGLRGFVSCRRPVVVRDNRGRVATGAITSYSADDQATGTQCSLTVVTADPGIGVV